MRDRNGHTRSSRAVWPSATTTIALVPVACGAQHAGTALSSEAQRLHDHEKGTSMHPTPHSCRGIPSTDHAGGRGLLVGLLLVLVAVSSACAWNKAGHMVSGAMAYAELAHASPQTLARVIALLKTHPHFETTWAPRLAQRPLSPEEQALYLFMLAARWPDDIRGDPTFHHGAWHYINLPYKPEGQPPSVQTVDPPPENILSAYQTNLDILRSTAPESTKAVALCWVFHLIGDVHQPLHTVALFTTQFLPPEGDRGGTRFYIRVREGRRL